MIHGAFVIQIKGNFDEGTCLWSTNLFHRASVAALKIAYLDCSPVFFNLPLPKSLWKLWRWLDAKLSCSVLSFMCASGVLMAYAKK